MKHEEQMTAPEIQFSPPIISSITPHLSDILFSSQQQIFKYSIRLYILIKTVLGNFAVCSSLTAPAPLSWFNTDLQATGAFCNRMQISKHPRHIKEILKCCPFVWKSTSSIAASGAVIPAAESTARCHIPHSWCWALCLDYIILLMEGHVTQHRITLTGFLTLTFNKNIGWFSPNLTGWWMECSWIDFIYRTDQ